jgi:hypothetical protein
MDAACSLLGLNKEEAAAVLRTNELRALHLSELGVMSSPKLVAVRYRSADRVVRELALLLKGGRIVSVGLLMRLTSKDKVREEVSRRLAVHLSPSPCDADRIDAPYLRNTVRVFFDTARDNAIVACEARGVLPLGCGSAAPPTSAPPETGPESAP